MQLRAFAEQILFATTLEEKLRWAEGITDEQPGAPLLTPDAPGRPAGLTFKVQGSRTTEFPGAHRLENEIERGKLLHFFANHELLATELMALVLLRFPDAPAAFRRGVLQTLRDEQMHTKLYLHRMKECGIEFGEMPVSGYFWRCVSPMEHPMDYVSALSLTFEQANLDFCRHYAQQFGAVGDADTARLLDRIYHDEIGHVAYGLKWFRRWKNPNENDWQAFCQQLKFPLSPQRAKGITLNVEGRHEAGFDAAFIAELNVYSQSKGRTPNVFVFNPFAEGRIAEGKQFNPTKHQAALARDLANLPQFLCRQDDLVLVDERPTVEFLSSIKQAGFALPEFVERKALSTLAERKLGRLRPWAWAPDSMELLAPLFGSINAEKRTNRERFNERSEQLYSKAWSAQFLRDFLSAGNQPPWLCPEIEVGVAASTVAEALSAIESIRRRGHQKVVIKQAFGLAGSNALRLWEPEISDAQRRWLANSIHPTRPAVVEPWLERAADFSVQLEMEPAGLKLCGYTGLINDARGQFQVNTAETYFRRRIPSNVISLFNEPGNVAGQLHALYADIFKQLEVELRRASFLGPFGIDAFVYRAVDGRCRLKPVVEINPRYTMGRVTVELMNNVCQGSGGKFQLVNQAQLRAAGFEDFPAYARALTAQFPLRCETGPQPAIREGIICLNDPAAARVCLATFQVQRGG